MLLRLPRLTNAGCALATLVMSGGCGTTSALSNQYGNTLHYQAVDGPLELWFWTHADRSYQGWARGVPGEMRTAAFAGSWRIVEGKNCRQQLQPPPSPGGGLYCEPLRHFTLGHTVLSTDGRFRVTLERGLEHPPLDP